jgi:hypothetical protein
MVPSTPADRTHTDADLPWVGLFLDFSHLSLSFVTQS